MIQFYKGLRQVVPSLAVIMLLTTYAWSQGSIKVHGKVTDATTGEAAPGVNVLVYGTKSGTTTDRDGAYSLVTDTGAGELVFSFIGYKSSRLKIPAGQQEVTLDVALEEDVLRLNEVVVTGTATATDKSQLGNAISTVSAKDLRFSGAQSIDAALTGKISGAIIQQNSGNPAGGISVRLRGTSTIIGNSDPLYIIDGVIVNNESPQLLDLGGYAQNRLVDINPNDIDRIEIIKGAAAAAIYGSRASNGVVQIFTKRGTQGKPVVTFSSSLKISSIVKKLEVNQYPFRFNNTTTSDLTQTAVQRYDYQDDIFRTAIGNDTYVSVSGGTDKTKYFVSGNYFKNQGIIDNTDFSRYGARMRVQQSLNDWASFSIGSNFVLSESREIPNGGINSAYGALTGFIFSNNDINPYPDPVTGVYPSTSPVAVVKRTNPLEAINRFDFRQRTSRYIGDLQLNLTPGNDFSIDYVFGVDASTQVATGFIPIGNTTPTFNTGFSRRSDNTVLLLNNDLTIAYKKKVNGFEFTTALGGTVQYEKAQSTALQGTDLVPIGQTISNAATIVSSEFRSDRSLMGAFIQETIGYADKYFLTAAFRIDASSVFSSDNRTISYPKFSGSYLISKENFWQNSGMASVVSNLKLRASYGQAGNLTPFGPYDIYSTYNTATLAGLPGVFIPSQKGNLDLKIERQAEKEFGVDVGLLNDRIGIEFTYYNKEVEDLILNRTLSPSTGFNNQYQNVGDLTNKGFELLVRAVPVQKKNLRWNLISTYSVNRNNVNGIEGNGILPFAGGFSQVAAVNGEPLGAFYSTFFARNDDGSLLLTTTGLPQRERGIQGVNGTFTIQRDGTGQPSGTILSKVIGDPNPDFVASFINEVEWKKFSFRLQLDGMFGFDVFNFTKRVGDRDLYGGLQGYEPELRGEVPKGTSAALFAIFENWIEDGTFVKVRELSISYNVTPRALGLQNLRVSIAGRNLFTFTNYNGMDPETNAAGQSTAVRGFDFVEVPNPRMINIGFTATF